MFSITRPYGFVLGSYLWMIEATSAHLSLASAETKRRGATVCEIRQEAYDDYFRKCLQRQQRNFLFTPTCAGSNTYYLNNHGDSPFRPSTHGAFGAQMVERGSGGHIVNIASAAAFTPTPVMSAYSVSKAGVKMLTECLRLELGPKGIGVSAICLGVINPNIGGHAITVCVDEQLMERGSRSPGSSRSSPRSFRSHR